MVLKVSEERCRSWRFVRVWCADIAGGMFRMKSLIHLKPLKKDMMRSVLIYVMDKWVALIHYW